MGNQPKARENDLRVLRALLAADAAGKRLSGFGIIDAVSSRGLATWIYPALARLEEDGWVVGEWEGPEIAPSQVSDTRRPPRRLYRLTETGLRTAIRLAASEAPQGQEI